LVLLELKLAQIVIRLFSAIGLNALEVLPKAEGAVPSR
jgi:hypothetical protein